MNKISVYIFIAFTTITAQSIKPDYENFIKKISPDSVSVYEINLSDGSEFYCLITDYDSTTVYFKSLEGLTGSVNFKHIDKIYRLSGNWNGNEFERFNIHDTHLLLSPTGINLKAGNVYLSFVEILFPALSVGVTDYLTLGLGASIPPTGNYHSFYSYGKINIISYKNIYFSGGVFAILNKYNGGAYPFGVTTYSTKRFSFTLGGYLVENNNSQPYIGGSFSITNNVELVTENWVLPNSTTTLYSLAIRYSTESWGSDFGLIRLSEEQSGLSSFPWFGFHFKL